MPCCSPPRLRIHAAATLLLSLAVAACATQPAPAPAPVVASVAPPEKPPSAPRPVAAPKPLDLRWVFTTGPELCTALASGSGGSFEIQTTTARQILMTARFGSAGANAGSARPGKLSFSGPAGAWSVPGTWQRRDFTASRPLDELGVARVLSLLGGGTVSVVTGKARIVSARLPPSGAEGSAWVQCPKQMMGRS